MDARSEYTARLEFRRRETARLERLHIGAGNCRLAIFAAAGLAAWPAFVSGGISPWWLLLPGAAYAALSVWHERVLGRRRRSAGAAAFYELGLGRLADRWAGKGATGEAYLESGHPYAEDLDLFGRGSLFELLCTARTSPGEETLAAWLKTPAAASDIRARQEAVGELRGELDLREDLAVLGADLRSAVPREALAAWALAPPVLASAFLRRSAAALAGAAVLTLAGWAMGAVDRWVFALLCLLELGFAACLRKDVRRVLEAAENAGRDLSRLSGILARLERANHRSPLLARLRSALDCEGLAPSVQISRLNRLIVLLDSRRNQLFAPLAGLMLWGTQWAFAVEAWRRRSGPAVPRWLAALGEMEALCALAGYAYEHPADPFPVIEEAGPCFDGTGLGHPLIADDRCVRNDVRLSDPLRVLVVSGSNMSGKSTLLRTVGVNAILAMAGAPVRARALRLSPLAVGASIRILDSLQTGSSRFYAEIKRLRQLVIMTAGPLPLLFLFDELLHGTNSHDRRVGAEAVVRDLVKRGAIGLLTTHDLALSHIADALTPRAANVHFQDQIEDGRIIFDYRLRPGIVRKSNALELMRSVGLEV